MSLHEEFVVNQEVKYGVVPPPPGCLYEGALTKKALMSFPAGSVLVGNCFTHGWMPALIRVMPPENQMEEVRNNVVQLAGTREDRAPSKMISSRELIWTMVKRGRWNGLKCYVFCDRQSAKRWVESIGGRFPVVAATD